MKKLILEGSAKTPYIEFDPEKKYILIKGRSIPENSIEFYQPLIDRIENLGGENSSNYKVDIQLEYFNTSSSKCILDIFKKLEKINNNTNNIKITWYYEEDDEDMLEAGEDYQSIINLPFNMVEIANN